ncbi:MAG: hypothetical protein AAF399_08540 [Bacteroidota bacterium]
MLSLPVLLPPSLSDWLSLTDAEEPQFEHFYQYSLEARLGLCSPDSLPALPGKFEELGRWWLRFLDQRYPLPMPGQAGHEIPLAVDIQLPPLPADPFLAEACRRWAAAELAPLPRIRLPQSARIASVSGIKVEHVDEPQAEYRTAIDLLRPHYQKNVDRGIRLLKMRLKEKLARSEFPEIALEHERQSVKHLFLPMGGKHRKKLARAWKVPEKEVVEFLSEIHGLVTGELRVDDILFRRSWKEIERRKRGKLLEPESWLRFYRWLQDEAIQPSPADTATAIPTIPPIKWLASREQAALKLLYHELQKADLLHPEISRQNFLALFQESDPTPVSWNGTLRQLMYLLESLSHAGWLPASWQQGYQSDLVDYFLSARGQQLNARNLTANRSKVVFPPKGGEQIDHILGLLTDFLS